MKAITYAIVKVLAIRTSGRASDTPAPTRPRNMASALSMPELYLKNVAAVNRRRYSTRTAEMEPAPVNAITSRSTPTAAPAAEPMRGRQRRNSSSTG